MTTDQELIDSVTRIEDDLSDWELEFLVSVTNRTEAGATLTDSQRETLELINIHGGKHAESNWSIEYGYI